MLQRAVSEPDPELVRRLVRAALDEDHAYQDLTTAALVGVEQRGSGVIIAKAQGVLAGLPVARAVFQEIDSSLLWEAFLTDGGRAAPGQRLAMVRGAYAPILRGERVALNFLQRLSGIASATAAMAEALQGLPVCILDTRKTAPGLRVMEKYAVRMGGGMNHRLHLADGILIKDNHLAALRARGLTIADGIRLARRNAGPGALVEVEVTSLAEVEDALGAGADMLLLDNMDLRLTRQAVQMAKGRAITEASGGITLASVRAVAETGVDYISSGAITHSAHALDISLELELA